MLDRGMLCSWGSDLLFRRAHIRRSPCRQAGPPQFRPGLDGSATGQGKLRVQQPRSRRDVSETVHCLRCLFAALSPARSGLSPSQIPQESFGSLKEVLPAAWSFRHPHCDILGQICRRAGGSQRVLCDGCRWICNVSVDLGKK